LSTQLLFYSNAVPVSSQNHGDLSVKTGGDFSFARSVNSVPLTTVEFRRATPEFAVVFAGEGESIVPVAILGAQAEHNAFVKDDGTWDGTYVPAFVRRYPFVFASSDDGKTFTLCIDDAFSGCNREGRGERLFDADANRTQYLETVLNFVKEYQVQFQRTRAFCARLKELDLLEPMQATFTLPSGERRNLTGFMAVNRTKLKALEDETLAQMAKSDELELIYLHLQSMQNFSGMLKRIGAKPETEAAAQGEVPAQETEGDGAPPIH
jgi:hypothetical protein